MTKKRFVYYEHKGADYILDTPNTELDFIEMLGDTLEPEEIVDLLNEQDKKNIELSTKCSQLEKENKQLKERLRHLEYRFTEYRIKLGDVE